VHPLYIELLMGHDIALKGSYFRPTIQDMLEGNDRMLGYTAAIDALTINEENRLKLKVSKLEKENENEEERDRQIQGLIKKQEQLETLIQSLIDSGQLRPG
jgi:predicted RNA-binding protein with RPS1 domain